MQKYQENVLVTLNGILAPNSGAVVTIQNTSGGSSQMYSDNGITQINSTSTNGAGFYSFYAADGKYTITGIGQLGNFSRTDVELFDAPASGGSGSIGDNAGGGLWTTVHGGLVWLYNFASVTVPATYQTIANL